MLKSDFVMIDLFQIIKFTMNIVIIVSVMVIMNISVLMTVTLSLIGYSSQNNNNAIKTRIVYVNYCKIIMQNINLNWKLPVAGNDFFKRMPVKV